MSKKKKTKARKPDIQNKYLQTLPNDEKWKIVWEVLFFSIANLILLVTVFEKYVNSPNVPKSFSILWRTVVVILLIVRSGGNRVILKSMRKHKDYANIPIPKQFQKIMRIISIAIIAIIIFPSIYYSPLREQLSILLVSIKIISQNIADKVSGILSAILATISGYIGNIILGALGNLFYDLANSFYSRFQPKKNNPSATKRK